MSNITDGLSGQGGQLETILQILFGQKMQEYQTRFTEVDQMLTDTKQDFQTAMQEQEQRMNLQVGSLTTEVAKKSDALADNDQQLMGKLDALESRLSERMQQNHEALMEKIEQLQEDKLDRKRLGSLLIDIGNQISM